MWSTSLRVFDKLRLVLSHNQRRCVMSKKSKTKKEWFEACPNCGLMQLLTKEDVVRSHKVTDVRGPAKIHLMRCQDCGNDIFVNSLDTVEYDIEQAQKLDLTRVQEEFMHKVISEMDWSGLEY